MNDGIQVGPGIIITIWLKHAYTKTHTTFPARESPSIASRGIMTTHNKKQFILGVVWSVHIIFSTIAIAVKGITHASAYSYMSRKAAGIDGHGGQEIDAFA